MSANNMLLQLLPSQALRMATHHAVKALLCCFDMRGSPPLLLLPLLLPLFPGIMRHTRPEFIYFWFYFVIVNGVWLVVPMACMIHAAKHINHAIAG